jgi:hypothetical protein
MAAEPTAHGILTPTGARWHAQPRCELQALLAVQIIATGFAGLRFLRQSHRQMTEDYINVCDHDGDHSR